LDVPVSGTAHTLEEARKVEEKIGDLTGLESWKTSGQQRQVEGNVEHKQAQAEGYAEGAKKRVVGTFEKLKGTVTGDTSQEVSGDLHKEQGKVQQDINSS